MDDWEQRFIEKSRRRFESERRQRRNRLIRAWVAWTLIALIIIAGVAELAVQR